MTYIASYYTDRLFSLTFQSLEELKEYNTQNNLKNHNLELECNFNDILENGIIVCLEGDDNLSEEDLSTCLKNYGERYLLLNNLYTNPQKLAQLKDKDIDVLVVQSTRIKKEEIYKMQEMYIQNIGNFPKNIVCVLGDEDEFLYPLIKAAPFEINVYSYQEVEKNEIVLSRWLGTKYQNEN